MTDDRMSTGEAAAALGVSVASIRSKAPTGIFDSRKDGRNWTFSRDLILASATEAEESDDSTWVGVERELLYAELADARSVNSELQSELDAALAEVARLSREFARSKAHLRIEMADLFEDAGDDSPTG